MTTGSVPPGRRPIQLDSAALEFRGWGSEIFWFFTVIAGTIVLGAVTVFLIKLFT